MSVNSPDPTKDSGKDVDADDTPVPTDDSTIGPNPSGTPLDSSVPTDESTIEPDPIGTPEKVPTELAVGEWHLVGSGMIEMAKTIEYNYPTGQSVYKTEGAVNFDLWERKDVNAIFFKVIGTYGIFSYTDKTTLDDCSWEIAHEGKLTIDGNLSTGEEKIDGIPFDGKEQCHLLVTIAEVWGQPSVVSTTCSGIEPGDGNITIYNRELQMDFIKNSRLEFDNILPSPPGTTMTQEEVYILRDAKAHIDTGCAVFEPEVVP